MGTARFHDASPPKVRSCCMARSCLTASLLWKAQTMNHALLSSAHRLVIIGSCEFFWFRGPFKLVIFGFPWKKKSNTTKYTNNKGTLTRSPCFTFFLGSPTEIDYSYSNLSAGGPSSKQESPSCAMAKRLLEVKAGMVIHLLGSLMSARTTTIVQGKASHVGFSYSWGLVDFPFTEGFHYPPSKHG